MKKLLLIIFFASTNSLAEYRVYQYTIKNMNKDNNQSSNIKYIKSTLNPVAYKAYHGGGNSLQIDLLRTWICPGYTGNKKDLCESPYKKLSKEAL